MEAKNGKKTWKEWVIDAVAILLLSGVGYLFYLLAAATAGKPFPF